MYAYQPVRQYIYTLWVSSSDVPRHALLHLGTTKPFLYIVSSSTRHSPTKATAIPTAKSPARIAALHISPLPRNFGRDLGEHAQRLVYPEISCTAHQIGCILGYFGHQWYEIRCSHLLGALARQKEREPSLQPRRRCVLTERLARRHGPSGASGLPAARARLRVN